MHACEQDYQIDWEAILCQHCPDFVASVSAWLYPQAAQHEPAQDAASAAAAAQANGSSCWDPTVLPSVKDLLPTLRNRLEALNGPDLPRI